MEIVGNRVRCSDLHDELIELEPWGGVDGERFIGKIVFSEEFAEDDSNVSVYSFHVRNLVEDFLCDHTRGDTGKVDDDGATAVNVIIEDLEGMISMLKSSLPGTDGKYGPR